MNQRQLGCSDLYVSEIGLGCMSLGTTEAEAIRIIHTAIDQGINFLDTADLYNYGLNESFVGKALKGKRKDIVLATKAGNRWTEEKNGWFWDPSKQYIKEAVKNSLLRLQTDYIDLYQLHGGTIEDNIEETIEAFDELQQEGLIRYYGISSIRPNVIKEYASRSNIVSVLMEYNILNRRPEELFSYLQEYNISIIARGPLAKGLLTHANERKLEKAREKGYLSYSIEELERTLHMLHSDRPLQDTAIQYCLHNPIVASVIPGASSEKQAVENAKAANAAPLTEDEYEFIQEVTKQDKYEQHC
ncbi:aldo/keto reductase [Bacillus sp. 165]|uniref:aldo/keto reductase n=1 Tax=Bacillus sp. 165 TaxID=1529117 RepID=UPI001AD97C0E|nr:aldo/keto reductase [Bacillus sp. 165]MBO9129795.1 aldo/keto reductase [Bacillus sp. 165]